MTELSHSSTNNNKKKKEKKKKTAMGFYADVKKHEICGRALMESGVL